MPMVTNASSRRRFIASTSDRFADRWARGAVLWPLAHALLGSSGYYDSLWQGSGQATRTAGADCVGDERPGIRPQQLARWREVLPIRARGRKSTRATGRMRNHPIAWQTRCGEFLLRAELGGDLFGDKPLFQASSNKRCTAVRPRSPYSRVSSFTYMPTNRSAFARSSPRPNCSA